MPGLRGIEFCAYIFVLYWMDRADSSKLAAVPPGSDTSRGVFATRSTHRPNPIGIGIADLLEMQNNILKVRG